MVKLIYEIDYQISTAQQQITNLTFLAVSEICPLTTSTPLSFT
ncbi:hypothetical protein ECDEC6B_2557 [Escherichia coli DEC6B]|nr:hypothetical protein ECDEC6B_2557 [Escherichia coli DEC6B]